MLKTNEETILESKIPTFATPCAPTIEECDASFIPKQNNFSETFDCPSFIGKLLEKVVKTKRI